MLEPPREQIHQNDPAEAALSREFPELHAFYASNAAFRPRRSEIWERILRVARNTKPILEELSSRGLNLIRLEHYTPPGTDRRPLYEVVLKWLPRIQDPLTLTICLGRLTEPAARPLVIRNREVLLQLAREWNEQLAGTDVERTLSVLAQCVMRAAQERDLREILIWVRDSRLPTEARASYVLDLQRFAKKPGAAREALLALVADADVGGAAVWAIAGAMKAEALPLLEELRHSSPHDAVREASTVNAKKLSARLRRLELLDATPAMLPEGFDSTSIEFDTERTPELLSALEEETGGRLGPPGADQLSLSADQIRSRQRRFHILPLTFADGADAQLGFGLYGEDEDTLVLEVHFERRLRAAIERAMNRFLDRS